MREERKMKRPAWKTVNAEIAKKHREEKVNKEKLEQKFEEQRRAYERISRLGYVDVQHTYPNIVKFQSVYRVDGRQMYRFTFKEHYRFIRERIMESLASKLIDYVKLDGRLATSEYFYSPFDEVWEGTIEVVDRRNEK